MTGAKTMDKPTEIDEASADLQREGYWDADAAKLEHVPPKDLKDSPLNYRQTYDQAAIDEIASTAKDLGILQTLLARPVGKNGEGRELVFGHNRKRAAIQVGLETVPVLVRPMTDKEVRLAQMVENTKRADVHPLEEADGLNALLTEEGMTVTDMAAALARSSASIYRRIALTHLCKQGREQFFKGNMRTGVAELIARLGDVKAQVRAVKELAGESHDGGLMTVKAAKRHIERDYLRELKGAPFDPKDAELIPSAGACGPCPKRTGANPGMFGDLQGKNVCTDGVCFGEKSRATWKAKSKEHRTSGGTVLEKKAELAKAFPYKHSSSLAYDCGYSDLDKSGYHGEPTRAAVLKKAKADLPPIVLARDPTGGIRRLVLTTDMNKAMKAVGGGRITGGHSSAPRTPAQRKADDRRDREADIGRRVVALSAASIVGKLKPHHSTSVGFWHMLANIAIDGAWHDTNKATCSRRGIVIPKGGSPCDELLKHAKAIATGKASPDSTKATTCELLAALVIEVMLKATNSLDTDKWKTVRAFLRIDQKKLEKKARYERAAEEKAKRDAAKAKAAKKGKVKKKAKRKAARKKARKK